MPEVTLQLVQPAALGRRPRGTAPVETYRHLPGSVLRGALAAAWIREYGPPQTAAPARRDEFVHLFEGPVRYGPLLDPMSAVVPLSVLRCKYRPEPACHTTAIDQSTTTPPARPRCTHCKGPMTAGTGEVEFFGTSAPVLENTRVALTAEERAADGQLFTRRSLSHRQDGGAPRELHGHITTPPGPGTDWLEASRPLHIGGRRSTGGAAVYTPHPATTHPGPDPAALITDGRLTVRLLSPAVLVDTAGRPTDLPDRALLSSLLGTEVTVDQATSWTRRERVGGWNALTNLPKSEELAVSAGSVFVLHLAAAPHPDGLRALLDHGLGLRRAEGFGWIELGPWTLPQAAAEAAQPRTENLYTGMAALLYDSGAGARYARWLRECAQRRRRGEPGGDRFLTLPAAEGLLLNDRISRLLPLVLAKDAADLERILVHLEARVREGRR